MAKELDAVSYEIVGDHCMTFSRAFGADFKRLTYCMRIRHWLYTHTISRSYPEMLSELEQGSFTNVTTLKRENTGEKK